jgi:predicted permease
VINVTLPVLIFCQLTRDFNFREFSYWWIFPLLSIVVTLAGFIIGGIFIFLIKGAQKRLQFLSLVAFQNSGYLP